MRRQRSLRREVELTNGLPGILGGPFLGPVQEEADTEDDDAGNDDWPKDMLPGPGHRDLHISIENRSAHIQLEKLVEDFLSRGKLSEGTAESHFAGRIHILEDKMVIRVRSAAIPTEEDCKADLRAVATEWAIDGECEGSGKMITAALTHGVSSTGMYGRAAVS